MSQALFRTFQQSLPVHILGHLVVRMHVVPWRVQYMYMYVGQVLSTGMATLANKKVLFVTLVVRVPRFEAY